MSTIRRSKAVTTAVAEEFFQHHLPYEIDMMRGLYPELTSGKFTRLIHNSNIESFHFHARNLIEFFKNKKPCDFDPRLFTEPPYEPNGNFISASLEAKINQQISHLTALRTSIAYAQLGPSEWTEIGVTIEKEIERFETALKPAYKAKWKYNLQTYIYVGSGSGTSSEVVGLSNTNTAATLEGSFLRIIDSGQKNE
jgi:hypothetical protein